MEVTFTWEGREHTGELKPVSGAGNVYHLMIKNYYQGQLVRTVNGWSFSTQKHGYIPQLAKAFGCQIDRKYQSGNSISSANPHSS